MTKGGLPAMLAVPLLLAACSGTAEPTGNQSAVTQEPQRTEQKANDDVEAAMAAARTPASNGTVEQNLP